MVGTPASGTASPTTPVYRCPSIRRCSFAKALLGKKFRSRNTCGGCHDGGANNETGGELQVILLCLFRKCQQEGSMGRGILLWLLGIPIPIIILLALFWH